MLSAHSSLPSEPLTLRERERLPACWLALKVSLQGRREDSLLRLLQDDRGAKPASLDSLLGDVALKQKVKAYNEIIEMMTQLEQENMND